MKRYRSLLLISIEKMLPLLYDIVYNVRGFSLSDISIKYKLVKNII